MVSIGHRREGTVERKNFEAVARKIEIANDFRPQQRDNVGKNGKFEAGKDFFSDCGAAENVAALEDEDFFAGAGEIRGVYQAIVATTNDNCVVTLRHKIFLRTLNKNYN